MIGTWIKDDDEYLTCFPEQIIDSNLYIMNKRIVLPYAKTIQDLLYTYPSDNGCVVEISDEVFTISNIIAETTTNTSVTQSTNTSSSTVVTTTETTEISSSTSSVTIYSDEADDTTISPISTENFSTDDGKSSFSIISIIILIFDIVLLGIVVLLFRK